MAIHLPDSLLALVASIDGDGGHAVCRTLASLLRDTAPFDAGEVVLRQDQGFHRFPFGVDERPVVGDDVVARVLANGAPLRLDDQRDLEVFPETRDRMAEAGLKSALILPLGTILHVQVPLHGSSPSGVLALARRHGWAFVGASLNFLGPLSAMAGLALDRSLALTALGHPAGQEAGAEVERRDGLRREGTTLIAELQALRAQAAANVREIESLRSSLAVVRDDLADARGASSAAQSALDQAVNRCRELQARLDRGDLPKREGGGGGSTVGEAVGPGSAAAESEPVETAATETALPEASADEPAAAAPVADGAVADAPVADEPAANEPAANTPVAGEPMAVEQAAVEPAIAVPTPPLSRRARRRRRGAFEPPGGPGA